MTTRSDVSTSPKGEIPPWHRSDWSGPRVEVRPADAGAEWPTDAVERVIFTREDFADSAFPHRLPQTLYFGADGWPLITPASVRSRLDPRCKAELHRYPWVARPECWSESTWVRAFESLDRHRRWSLQATLIRGEANHPPQVRTHH